MRSEELGIRNEQSRPELLLSTERSDFAVTETCPNICRGEQRSPMLRNCCKFSILGDGAPDVPFRGSSKVWIFYKVEWVNETGELPRFVRLSRFA